MCAARASAALFALALCLPAGATAEDLELTPAERDAFGREVRALLLEEPEIVERALGMAATPPGYAEAIARDTALLDAEEEALAADSGDWAEGPEDGTPLVVFLPPACPDCLALLGQLREMAAARGDTRLVVKDMPDPEHGGTTAARYLTAVLAELGPEAWLQAREGLAALPDPANPAALELFAQTMAWPAGRLMEAMEAPATDARLDRVESLAGRLGLDIAPSFVVAGILVRGQVPPVVLERYLDRAEG